ncbi:MAG: hypothetical protein AB1483_12425 [Candidatus Zixiibacteriota bacterium]
MKRARVKKVLLVLLIVVAGYIWWGNFQMMASSSNTSYSPPDILENPRPVSAAASRIEYEEPRINPFKREIAQVQPEKPQLSRNRTASPVQSITPSMGSVLKGLIVEQQTPQAVVKINDGTSKVLSIGDSLHSWELVKIGDRQIIFRREKARDTLWLEGTKP